MKAFTITFCVLAIFTATTHAQSKDTGKGQGAIVITDGATVYKNSEGDEAYSKKLEKGYALAGVTTLARMVMSYQFENENGRVHVFGVTKVGGAAMGWMNRADLSSYFTYECGCGLVDAKCSPHSLEGFHFRYNICFEEARDRKLAELASPPPAAPVPTAASSESVETRLQKLNDLFKKGLISEEEYKKTKAQILESM
jgi:Short C-terminal domain